MPDVLDSLVDKSLVQCESRFDTIRFRLLESTRQYANEKLHQSGENVQAAHAHALAVLTLVERFSPLNFISDRTWKTEAQPEIENWRAAMRWAFGDGGEVVVGQRLAAALNDVWFSQAAEGLHWVRRAIESCDDATPPALRAKLELAQVTMAYPLGRGQTGATFSSLERALRLYNEVGDRLGVATAQIFIGERLLFKGRITEAEALLQSALAVAEERGARRIVAIATRCLGIARSFAGDAGAARQLIRKSLEMYKAGGSTSHQATIQGLNLAEVEFQAGNAEAALELALESVEIHREYNATFILATVLSNAAAYAVSLERFVDAGVYGREALLLASEGEFEVQFAWASQHLAAVAALRQRGDDALRRKEVRFAARTIGFVDARLAELERERGFTEQQEYKKVLCALCAQLGTELDALMSEGATSSRGQIFNELMEF